MVVGEDGGLTGVAAPVDRDERASSGVSCADQPTLLLLERRSQRRRWMAPTGQTTAVRRVSLLVGVSITPSRSASSAPIPAPRGYSRRSCISFAAA